MLPTGICQPVATPKEIDRSEMVAPCPCFCNKEPKPLHPPGMCIDYGVRACVRACVRA